MVILCVILVLQCSEHGVWVFWGHLAPLWVATVIVLLTLFFFNPNEVGIHAFYRSRLARTYLGASNYHWQKDNCNRVSADCEKDDLRLDELSGEKPFHLICCAANDLAGDQLENLFRGAKSATLSRLGFSVGDRWTAWSGVRTVPTVGDAITASGAAFNSHMGWHSMEWGPAVTFLMTAFNLRLGLWLPHPTQWYRERSPRPWLLGWPFFKELFSFSRAQGPDVHLSDGGHFEDLALYELVRRHCRYILVSDCGADPDVAFDDLGNAVRRVREDFGAEIVIDLSPLRPGPDGFARQPMVAGDIHYPGGDTGVLLVLKPTLIGDEPVDILQYKRRNGAFPHETTGDQFYDAAQWESYRRLGQHAVQSAFRTPVKLVMSRDPSLNCGHVFAKARFEWLPVPVAAHENFPHLAKRCSELEELLRNAQCKTLLHEVYKEIDELDRQELGVAPPKPAEPPVQQGPAPGPVRLSSDELLVSLQILRVAILFMEEVFFTLDLDTQYTHPVNLGWINYFARWAYSPLFRMWWPLLRPMFAARFTCFLEERFSLARLVDPPSAVEDVTGTVGRGEKGFAWACWLEEQKPNSIPPGWTVLSYNLRMRFHDKDIYEVQAAVLLVHIGSPWACWAAEDLYVPPGLWGAGIGGAFLTEIEETLAKLGVSLLVVRRRIPQPDLVARKRSADAAQLFRCAHFSEARLDKGMIIAGGLPIDPGTLFSDGAKPSEYNWMYKKLELG
jgi:GNAT superfamily N-acetyltransferase